MNLYVKSCLSKTLSEEIILNEGKRKTRLLFLFFIVLALIILMTSVTMANKQSDLLKRKIDDKLFAKISKAKPGQKFDVVVKLQPVLRTAKGTGADKPRSLKEINSSTKKSQSSILASLKTAKDNGQVASYNSLWITNAIVVKADDQTIRNLALLDDVSKVFPNFKVSLANPVPSKASAKSGRQEVGIASPSEWNINKIKAPDVWNDLSVTGTSTKVAVLDTGIDATHPDLAGKVEEFVEVDEYGKISTTTPRDTHWHGTHVSGTIAGGDAGGTAIGVAPGTKLIGAIALPGGGATFAQVMGAMQWAADPDGDLGTTVDRPDAANMSFGGGELLAQMYEPIDNMVAAGVVPVSAAGNWGPGSVDSPADVPTAFAIGATDNTDTVGWFSGGGEVTWYDPPHEGTYIKPDASAPGVSVKSSVPNSSYGTYSGTSMATPHVAGAAALLRSLKPNLTVTQISRILQQSSVDLGEKAKDTRYGSGRIDVLAAATLANSFGTVQGTVASSTGPLTSAIVQVVKMPEDVTVTSVKTDKDGKFAIETAPGDYKLSISRYGYDPVEEPTFTIVDGETKNFSYELAVAAKYSLTGTVRKASDGTPLSGEVKIISPVRETTQAVSGNYSFSVPNGEYTVRASAYGYQDEELTVTINNGNNTLNFNMQRVNSTLLVVDIGAGPYKDYFTTAMDTLGYNYDVIEFDPVNWDWWEQTNGLDPKYFKQYKKIVWAAGDGPALGTISFFEDENKITPPALAEYLDSGGKLFLTGQDVAYFASWNLGNVKIKEHEEEDDDGGEYVDFIRDYLFSSIIKDKANNLTISGLPKTIFDGKTMDLLSYGNDENGAKNQFWPDLLRIFDPAIPELVYTKETTGAASLRTYTGEASKGKVVYFGFGFEGIDNTADRVQTMSKVTNWLDTTPGTLTIGTSKLQVLGFGSTVINGRLTPASKGQQIVIEQKISSPMGGYYNGYPDEGAATWVPVDVAVTDSSGYWSKRVYPDSNTLYRAVWSGNVQKARTKSAALRIRVKPVISARPDAGFVVAGNKVAIRGSVSPAVYGTMLTVLSKTPAQVNYRFETIVEVDESGEFIAKVTPRYNTSYKFVTEYSPELMINSLSGININAKHNLTLSAETKLAPTGVPIYISGKVLPTHPGSYMHFQVNEGDGWKTVKKIKLGSSQTWKTLYKGVKKGTFSFRTVLEKDALHLDGKSNKVTVRFY